MSGSRPVGVILSVDPDRFPQAVEGTRRAGLTVTGQQPVLGSLSGTVAEDCIPALEAVDGVEFVERDRTVHLAPPDPPDQ